MCFYPNREILSFAEVVVKRKGDVEFRRVTDFLPIELQQFDSAI